MRMNLENVIFTSEEAMIVTSLQLTSMHELHVIADVLACSVVAMVALSYCYADLPHGHVHRVHYVSAY